MQKYSDTFDRIFLRAPGLGSVKGLTLDKVSIVRDISGNDINQVIAHELFHQEGLDHVEKSGNLMNPDYKSSNTHLNYVQWKAAHGKI